MIVWIRKLLFAWLLVVLIANGWADDRWTVDGIWLGASQDQVKQPLTPHQGFKNMLTWQGEPLKAYGQPAIWVHSSEGVVLCQGRELRLGARLLTRTGGPVANVNRLLGKPYSTTGALGWCAEDPCYWQHYRRAGGKLSILVSNDAFIRSNFPKKQWPMYLGKVWSVRLQSALLRELLESPP